MREIQGGGDYKILSESMNASNGNKYFLLTKIWGENRDKKNNIADEQDGGNDRSQNSKKRENSQQELLLLRTNYKDEENWKLLKA